MSATNNISTNRRLLVFDCHEASVDPLGALNRQIDVSVCRAARSPGWDFPMRPLPPNPLRIRLDKVLASHECHGCILAHNLTDRLDVKSLEGPRLLAIRATLGSLIVDQRTATA